MNNYDLDYADRIAVSVASQFIGVLTAMKPALVAERRDDPPEDE